MINDKEIKSIVDFNLLFVLYRIMFDIDLGIIFIGKMKKSLYSFDFVCFV